MSKLYDALDVCLKEMEQGADADTVLLRYSELADQLRPLLDAAERSKASTVSTPSNEIVQRNRARLLQHAAHMREQKAAPIFGWSVSLRRLLVTVTVLAMLFISGTSFVRAASTTLPGDNLYSVKRTWEDVRLFFTFDTDKREALEFEHENERLEELHELFAEGRAAKVDFAGYVTHQSGTEWRVSGITVFISAETLLPDQPVDVGAAVRIRGHVQNDMRVAAEQIEILPVGAKLPEVEDDDFEFEHEEDKDANSQVEDDSSSGSENEAPVFGDENAPAKESESDEESYAGVVISMDDHFILVDGVWMDIRFAEIDDLVGVGADVKVEGYYDDDGVFIVKKVEVEKTDESDSSSSTDEPDEVDDPDEPDEPDQPDEHH